MGVVTLGRLGTGARRGDRHGLVASRTVPPLVISGVRLDDPPKRAAERAERPPSGCDLPWSMCPMVPTDGAWSARKRPAMTTNLRNRGDRLAVCRTECVKRARRTGVPRGGSERGSRPGRARTERRQPCHVNRRAGCPAPSLDARRAPTNQRSKPREGPDEPPPICRVRRAGGESICPA